MKDRLTAAERRKYLAGVPGDFDDLVDKTPIPFSKGRRRALSTVPRTQGVYIIYGPRNQVLHVGKSARGREGLCQRLRNHWDGRSSFVQLFLEGDPTELRNTYKFAFLEISDPRRRALLESYATGMLCPLHLGLNAALRND